MIRDDLLTALHRGEPIEVYERILQEAPLEQTTGLPLLELIVAALVRRTAPEVSELLIRHDPTVVRYQYPTLVRYQYSINETQGAGGSHLLHVACRFGTPPQVISLLLKLYPEAAKIHDQFGYLPLYYACFSLNPSLEVVKELVAVYPAVLLDNTFMSGPDQQEKYTVLHLFCGRGRDLDEGSIQCIQYMLDKVPRAATVICGGELPIHRACYNGAPAAVVQKLLEVHPMSVAEPNCRGRIPLHCACEGTDARVDVCELLTNQYPDGLREDVLRVDGLIPIHVACFSKAPTDVVRFLADRDPSCVRVIAPRGLLPIHFACGSMRLERQGVEHQDVSDHELVQVLLESFRDSVRVMDADSCLPLHFAATGYVTAAGMQLILQAYPEAVRVPDKDGWLPLHHACDGTRSLAHVRQLVEQDVFTVLCLCKTTVGDKTPLQLAYEREHPEEAVKEYVKERQDEAVRQVQDAWEEVGEEELGFPDLVVDYIWKFAQPWEPPTDRAV